MWIMNYLSVLPIYKGTADNRDIGQLESEKANTQRELSGYFCTSKNLMEAHESKESTTGKAHVTMFVFALKTTNCYSKTDWVLHQHNFNC